MARNIEKSRSLFSQWNSLVSEKGGNKAQLQRRPGHTADCNVLEEAEKWRKSVIREALQKVASIASAELGEQRTRDMNDEINKLMRLKGHWDKRIVELGGQNYAKTKQQLDVEGKELPDSKGYKYYGAAKVLPGVREKFEEWDREQEQRKKKEKKKSRKEFLRGAASDNYYKTEENDILEAKELERENELVREAVQEHKSVTAKRRRMSGKAKGGDSDEDEEELHTFLRGEITSEKVSEGTRSPLSVASTGVGGEAAPLSDLVVDAKKSALLSKYQ